MQKDPPKTWANLVAKSILSDKPLVLPCLAKIQAEEKLKEAKKEWMVARAKKLEYRVDFLAKYGGAHLDLTCLENQQIFIDNVSRLNTGMAMFWEFESAGYKIFFGPNGLEIHDDDLFSAKEFNAAR